MRHRPTQDGAAMVLEGYVENGIVTYDMGIDNHIFYFGVIVDAYVIKKH